MSKLILIGVIIILLALSYWKAVLFGKDIQAGIEAQARQELINKQRSEVKKLRAKKNKIEVKWRDRVKKIYQTVDPTGCLDVKLSDAGLLPASSSD